MDRRDFCRLMGAGAGMISLPWISNAARGADAAPAAGTPTSFPVSDWDAVVGEGWGTTGHGAGADTWDGVPLQAPAIPGLPGDGPFKPEWSSLLNYQAPEWYQDAKFGIWAHWSPQCVPENGDWYARNMYIQGQGDYNYQIDHYNHPSKSGYKELCAQWTLLNWEPDALIERYQRAGARLFLALANHHDGFDAWNSK
ncbi:MAG TPA: alpha-L-fucosidase, partial [Armatimonadota bacterium]|nr:alpha-L-fucosidase [Armatimonadota bacterium]